MNNDSLATGSVDLPLHLKNDIDALVDVAALSPPPLSFDSRSEQQQREQQKSNGQSSQIIMMNNTYSIRSKHNPLSWMGLALASALLASSSSCKTAITANALSVSTRNVPGPRSLVDQARLLRQMKTKTADSSVLTNEPSSLDGKQRRMLSTLEPSLDNEAWVAALFEDTTISTSPDHSPSALGSLSSIVTQPPSKKNQKTLEQVLEEKRKAEEYDRFMEEDAEVSDLVKAAVGPGSLVEEVQSAKEQGVDIELDMEDILKMEAEKRRMKASTASSSMVGSKKMKKPSSAAKLSAPRKSTKATRATRGSSQQNQQQDEVFSSSTTTSSALLTREQEYKLARAIQLGTQIHNLKSDYEATNPHTTLSKKQWANLAQLSGSNELRRIIADYRTAKQELVSRNMGLVHAVVKTYRRKARAKGISMEELIQEGSLGLIRAAELFDPEKGLRFSTYATIWIKGVLSNYSFDEIIALPLREKTKWNKIQNALKDMKDERGGDVGAASSSKSSSSSSKTSGNNKSSTTTNHLSQQLGMKPTEVETTLRRMSCTRNVLSLDYQYTTSTRSGHSEGNTHDGIINSKHVSNSADADADLAERTRLHADVLSTLTRNLNEKEAQLMRLRYGLLDGQERTVKECASIMGINRETARKLQHACLKKLREANDAESLQEYLLTVA